MSSGIINTLPNSDFLSDDAKFMTITDNGIGGVAGNTTRYGVLKDLLFDYVYSKLNGFQKVLLSEQSQISQFAVNEANEYVIPANTTIEQSAAVIVWDRPLRLLGNCAYKGTINGSSISTAVSFTDGAFIRSNQCKFFHSQEMVYITGSFASPTPTPNLAATLFDLDQGTNTALWTDKCFLWETIALGFGSLGNIGGFDFIYSYAFDGEYNLNGITFKNANVLDLLSFIWQNGLGNGTILNIQNIKETLGNNLILRANANESAWNIIDSAFLERAKFTGGIYTGNVSNAFKAGSIVRTNPKVIIESFDPIPRSGCSAEYAAEGSAGGSVIEVPVSANDFYPFQTQLIVDSGSGQERLQITGSGANTRIVVTSKEFRKVQIQAIASLKGATGSVDLAVGIGVWEPSDTIGDNPVLVSDTVRYDKVIKTAMPGNASSFTPLPAIKIVEVGEGYYLKVYFKSSTTSNIQLRRLILTIIET